MSDINPKHMIPLYIADQAVANLNDELAQIRAERDQLRHRAEALREAGDDLWYALRHAKRLTLAETREAIDEWIAIRGGLVD